MKDIGYNIKYVAPHMRAFPKDPFSIRETGVYHSFDADTRQSSWVFMQASGTLRERLTECFAHSNETEPMVQFKIHGVILQTASDGWRDYLVYLEETFSKLVSFRLLFNPKCFDNNEIRWIEDSSQISTLNWRATSRLTSWTYEKFNSSPIKSGGYFKSSI